MRAKRNSGNPWNYADVSVVTQPNEPLYQINALDFGTPLAVITSNDFQNPNFVVRRIPFYLAADIATTEYGLPENAGQTFPYYSPYDPNHVALRCNITWRDNNPFIEFIPTGNQQATYVIRYLQSASGVDQMALSQTAVPAEDSDLIILRAAKSLLPHAEWDAGTAVSNAAKRKDLFTTLSGDEQLAREQFDANNLVVGGPRVSVRWQGALSG